MAIVTGKSRAEVAALRHLGEAYNALATEASDRRASPHGRRVVETVRALQSAAASPTRDKIVGQWLELETLAPALGADATALQREIDAADARMSAPLYLSADGFDTLDAKLLVLSDVLGREEFASYSRDLFRELATLRQRCALYSDELKRFQEQVQLRCIGAHRVRDVVRPSEWLEIANASLATGAPLLLSHIPVLLQHCSPPSAQDESDHLVAVPELLALLKRPPPARERLVSLCFEQISDVRRGSGFAPPPEGIRPHKLAALAKQSHVNVLCSLDERDRILAWLDEGYGDDGTVSRLAFLSFHVAVSDSFIAEDAEFVTFLMRVWGFEPPRDLGAGDVVADYELRCQERTNRDRKADVLAKIQHVRLAFPSRLAAMRLAVGQLASVSIPSMEQYQQLASNIQRNGATLVGLRVLKLRGLGLQDFPVFVAVLPLLEELDLADNQLRTALPLVAIGSLKTLQKLVLSDNFLTDQSFSLPSLDPEKPVWHGLTLLSTLELSRNQLTMIPRVVIEVPGLQHLVLTANKLRERGISAAVAAKWQTQGYPSLETLDVRENDLTTLPEVAFSTGKLSLQVCYAQANHLTDLPASFGLLECLYDFDFSNNQLQEADFTPLVTHAASLRALSLDNNRLKHWPVQATASAISIPAIQAIRCHKNRLRVLPSLMNLTFDGCEELDLRCNVITEVSETFFPAFPLLKICRLQQNRVARLPDSIVSCSQLQVLEVSENKLVYVPRGLATLHNLQVLNLRENQLTTIPTEWHAFASVQPLMLQVLNLQRNPLRNKVLQTLVDATVGNNGTSSAPFKSRDTQICELYVRKLIDTLKQSVPVLSLARAVDAEPLVDDEDENPRRRWKGRARFVLQYIETQLHRASPDAKHLVSATAFQKLLQKLLAASTKNELRLVSDRFASGKDTVDGWGFLCAVEAVGLFNTLPAMDSEPSRCETVRKPVDTVASILQYVQVAHEQKSQPRPVVDPTPIFVKPVKSAKASSPRRPQSAKIPTTKTVKKPKSQRCGRDDSAMDDPIPRQDRELERQKLRIQVLEQQLLDQRLLRLAEQTPLERAAPVAPIEPPRLDTHSSLLIHVKQLPRDDGLMDTTQERIVVAVPRDATVLQLKEAIASRLGVAVARQVLVAKTRRSGRDHERLCNDTRIVDYQEPGASRWAVSLIVSDPVRVDWSRAFNAEAIATGTSPGIVDTPVSR